MKTLSLLTNLTILTAALSGCAGVPERAQPEPVVPAQSQPDFSGVVQRQIDQALAEHKEGNVRGSAARLEALLDHYRSADGGMERAVLTTLALEYLELGYRDDFLRTADSLRQDVNPNVTLAPDSQYVIEIAQAMERQPQAAVQARGYDPRLARAVSDLLQD